MGNSTSLLKKEDLDIYLQLTFFTEAEIAKCMKRFVKLLPDEVRSGIQTDTITSINDQRCVVAVEDIKSGLEELSINPFSDGLCRVFGQGKSWMVFEEFLDMMSVLSESAPVQVKAEWAFRMFDSDSDGYLGRMDIQKAVLAITLSGEEQLDEERLDKVVDKVLAETDFNRTGFISLTEFKQIVTKS